MSAPRVWLLTGQRHGDTAQLRALAADLGWPAREIELAHNVLCQLPNGLLRASLASLSVRPEGLGPPWPDLVLGIGRRSVPAARWIARQAGGRARLAWLGRPRSAARHFDLLVTTPQYGVPDALNVLRLTLPWQAPMSDPPAQRSAHVLAILGGPSWSARPVAATVDALARRARERAGSLGLPLVATTSPRTPADLAARFRARLGPDVRLYDWGAERGLGNPYRADLAGAAEIVITGDSISALADAAWTNRPVSVIGVPCPGWLAAIDRCAGAAGTAWRRRGGNLGLAAPPPDPGAIRDALIARGLAHGPDPGEWRLEPCRAVLEAERRAVIDRFRALVDPSTRRAPEPASSTARL